MKKQLFRIIAVFMAIVMLSSVGVCGAGVSATVSLSDLLLNKNLYPQSDISNVDNYTDGKLSVDISELNIPAEQLEEEAFRIFAHHPELFYTTNTMFEATEEKAINIIFSLRDEASEIKKNIEFFNSQLENIYKELISCGIEDMNDTEKALLIHNYLSENGIYDSETYLSEEEEKEKINACKDKEEREELEAKFAERELKSYSHTAFGIVALGYGVCQSYSNVFNIVGTHFGLEVGIATNSDINHEWNIVKIGNSWYHLDATWDDTIIETCGQLLYTNFLISENEKREMVAEEAQREGKTIGINDVEIKVYPPYGKTYNPAANSIKGFWQQYSYNFEFTTFPHYYKGYWYYFNKDGNFVKSTINGSESIVLNCDYEWLIDGGKKTLGNNHETTFGIGNTVYYSVPNGIRQYNIDTKKDSVFASFDLEEGKLIIGIAKYGNTVSYIAMKVKDGEILLDDNGRPILDINGEPMREVVPEYDKEQMLCGTITDNTKHIFDNSCDTTCNVCRYLRKTTHKWDSG
ncbi:MAG: hypothetical protein MJ090_03770, partial [Clostridia bacterium]|nr:hypothetical protein [Clostridia bacterium]